MGWSRNLGTVATEDLESRVATCTTVDSVDLVAKKFHTTPQLDEDERETLRDAVAMARSGLVQLGGRGDVYIGGQVTHLPDGSTQYSVSATVTVTKPKP